MMVVKAKSEEEQGYALNLGAASLLLVGKSQKIVDFGPDCFLSCMNHVELLSAL